MLGLIFLKYISDAFEEQHGKLEAERKLGADSDGPYSHRLIRAMLGRVQDYVDLLRLGSLFRHTTSSMKLVVNGRTRRRDSMLREAIVIVRATLEELRSVFLGAASRHDATKSRWTIAESGYEPFRHSIMCPVVFFECKNYSNDVSSTEFAQLASRFSEKRSKVGFIVCRKIDDLVAIQERCRDHFQDKHEHILVLQDSDLLELLKMRSTGDIAAMSRYLHAKFRPIFLDK